MDVGVAFEVDDHLEVDVHLLSHPLESAAPVLFGPLVGGGRMDAEVGLEVLRLVFCVECEEFDAA